jgi:hypothetical protein
MPTATIVAVMNGVSTGLLVIGGAAMVLTLGIAGLCTMFSWVDLHIGGFIKKVFTSVLLGAAMMGGAGAFGVWMAQQFGM